MANRNDGKTAARTEVLEPRRLLAAHVLPAAVRPAGVKLLGPAAPAATVKPLTPAKPQATLARLTPAKAPAKTTQTTTVAEIVPGGRIVRTDTTVPLSTTARPTTAARRSTSGLNVGGFDVVLKKGPNLLANAAASAAFDQAALLVESYFSDPITVVVDAEIAPLAAGTLGQTGSTKFSAAFDTIRNAMVNGRNAADEAIVAALPTAAQFNAVVPTGTASNPYTLPGMRANRANLLAVGFSQAQLADSQTPNSTYDSSVKRDMEMTFNSAYNFDYDRSDGITGGLYDFIGVAAHEITHGLGFVSEVDRVDAYMSNPAVTPREIRPNPMDLFRLKPGVGATDFTNGERVLVPGNVVGYADQVVYDGGIYNPVGFSIPGLTAGDIPMSTGRVNGDGEQASHWKDNQKTGVQIGLLDPTTAGTGQQLDFTNADIRAMGLIGFDVAAAPITLTPGQPDLVAAYDTGSTAARNADNVTSLDNSTPAKVLQFAVSGTISGATVSIYSGATLIGSAVASGNTTTVTTNGTTDLPDGVRSITARQTEPGKTQSTASVPLSVTIDTVAPTLVSGTGVFQYQTVKPRVAFTYNESVFFGNGTLSVTRTSPNPGGPAFSLSTGVGGAALLTFPTSPNGILPDGRYTVTMAADRFQDLAGNSAAGTTLNFFVLAGDADHNAVVDFNDFLRVQANFGSNVLDFTLGDFTYDGVIDFNDFLVLQASFGKTV